MDRLRTRVRGDAGQGGGRDAGGPVTGVRSAHLHDAQLSSRHDGANRSRRCGACRMPPGPSAPWPIQPRDRAGRTRFPSRRRRRLNLLDRSGAWYPAATIAALPASRSGSMLRFYLLLARLRLDRRAFPVIASAQTDLSSCKVYSGDAGTHIERLEDNTRFYGTEDQPAQILCDDMQFFADYAEIFKKDRISLTRSRPRVLCPAATASGPTGWNTTPGPGPARSTTRAAARSSAIEADDGSQPVRDAGTRGRVLGRARSRRSGRRNTGSRAGGSRPACSPLPAGNSCRARSR